VGSRRFALPKKTIIFKHYETRIIGITREIFLKHILSFGNHPKVVAFDSTHVKASTFVNCHEFFRRSCKSIRIKSIGDLRNFYVYINISIN